MWSLEDKRLLCVEVVFSDGTTVFEYHPLSLSPFTSGEKGPTDQGRHGTLSGMEEEQQGPSVEVSEERYRHCLSS